jgi:uncharacterized protein
MADSEDSYPPVRELSRPQRRVLGTLLEKGFTTPDQYPLTLKAVTTGCNQKNNRDPVSNYSEDQVAQVLEELQRMGLVAVVHTESGRTERFRHYARKRFNFNEPQLAILTELLLRGRQSLGELRGRASRMVPVESLDDLRRELQSLMEAGAVESDGSLDRRGAEVDHGFYAPGEKRRTGPERIATQSEAEVFGERYAEVGAPAPAREGAGAIEQELDSLRHDLRSVREELASARDEIAALGRAVDDMQRQLGG